jgi:acyl CoA:acetate/3-ketoacid CoA transferase beta subunit
MKHYTVDELMCVCIARQVVDGEVLAQGINTPLVMAGYILAKLTHAPQVRFASAIGQGISDDWAPLSITRGEEHWLNTSRANVGFAVATAELLPKYNPKEFFRPAQIDIYGNFNNIAIGKDYSRPRLRLPGTGGIPDVTTYSEHIYLYVPRHSRVVFTKTPDFISGIGHSQARTQGRGPCYLVSDLGQFDWIDGVMRLITYHNNVSIERIRAKTGFDLHIADDISETSSPSDMELQLLREKIDPLGIRKLETLSGSARKQHLREILKAENASA